MVGVSFWSHCNVYVAFFSVAMVVTMLHFPILPYSISFIKLLYFVNSNFLFPL